MTAKRGHTAACRASHALLGRCVCRPVAAAAPRAVVPTVVPVRVRVAASRATRAAELEAMRRPNRGMRRRIARAVRP